MTLLIYDCDGVLVDSEPIAIAVLTELMDSLGRPTTPAEAMRAFAGRSLPDVLRQAEAMLGRAIPSHLGERAGQRLLERFRAELKPVVGAAATIGSMPYRRCVASSSAPARLALSLELTGLAALFGGHVYSAAQVKHGKPAPDLFLFAARNEGEAPARSIVIEDTVLGIAAARAAEMAAIGFTGATSAAAALGRELAAAGADLVVGSMAELPGAIEQLISRRDAS